MAWTRIAKNMPPGNMLMLLVIDRKHVTTGEYMPLLRCFAWAPTDDEDSDGKVTHWQPMPSPPEDSTND